jgi:hypothetical protein
MSFAPPHNNKPVNRHLPLLQALWYLWFAPSSLFNNHVITSYIPSLQIIICVKQASLHVVTYHAHASVIAWFLKTKTLLYKTFMDGSWNSERFFLSPKRPDRVRGPPNLLPNVPGGSFSGSKAPGM